MFVYRRVKIIYKKKLRLHFYDFVFLWNYLKWVEKAGINFCFVGTKWRKNLLFKKNCSSDFVLNHSDVTVVTDIMEAYRIVALFAYFC